VAQDHAHDRGRLRGAPHDERVPEVPPRPRAKARAAERNAISATTFKTQKRAARCIAATRAGRGEHDQRAPAPQRGHLEHRADLVRGAMVGLMAVDVVEAVAIRRPAPTPAR
jgi:hypothetical protein